MGQPRTVKPTGSPTDKTPLKILLLHGYTQSGDLFHAKARALEKHLQKSFPLHAVDLVFPTAPLALRPEDIPNFRPSSPTTASSNGDHNTAPEQDIIDAFAWWRRSNTADPPVYLGLDTGLEAIASILTYQGPFDGIIGFSQGAACAAMVTSLLEPHRRETFTYFSDPVHANTYHTTNCAATQIPAESAGATPISGIPFPAAFANVDHPPLKFAICYSGFCAPGPRYRAFYERPKIRTPVLHVLGTLDGIVDEGRSRMLVSACEGDADAEGRVVFHPGGHFLPSQRPYLDAAVRFIREALEGSGVAAKKDQQGTNRLSGVNVEDMDMPF
jgi:dihydrofolate reductase